MLHPSLKELEVCLAWLWWKELQINIFAAISYFDSFWYCAREVANKLPLKYI